MQMQTAIALPTTPRFTGRTVLTGAAETRARARGFHAHELDVDVVKTPAGPRKYVALVITPRGILVAGYSGTEGRALRKAFCAADALNLDI